MSLQKLSAGDGYAYLTRQVAAADDTNRGYGTLGAYYEEKGEAPGVWLGSGLGSCPSIVPGIPLVAAGGRVSEAQMTALFGEGRHPDANRIEDTLRSAGVRSRDLDRASRLGQKFPIHETSNVFRDRLAAVYRDHNQRHDLPVGAPIDSAIRARLRTGLATAMFTEEHHRPPADTRELSGFLARASRQAPVAVAGYDLTFSPVKSVSTLWAIAPAGVSQVVAACHQQAVEDVISWLEKTACFTRRGAQGVAQVETTGFLAAAFTHRDSRAGDPDLHTHVAISNKVCAADGQWLALDGRALYKNKVAASERYNTRLEALLTDRLGVRFADRADGPAGKRAVREIVGIDGELPRTWSARRARVETALHDLTTSFQDEHGRPATAVESLALAQQATLATRDRKHAPRSHAKQRATWRGEAIAVLGGEKALERYVQRALTPQQNPAAEPVDADVMARSVLATVQVERATWQVNHVRAEAERCARAAAVPLQDVDRFVDAVVETVLSPAVSIRITPADPTVEPGILRRSDGTSVYEIAGSARYTSAAILTAEHSVLALAGQTGGRAISPNVVGLALLESSANGIALGPDQAAMVRDLATSGARLQLALAPAGTGKTVALRALVAAWTTHSDTDEEDWGSVIGLAPSAAAAGVLRKELGANVAAVDTLAKLTHAVRTGQAVPEWVRVIGPQTLVVIDEAGMAGTLDLADAINHVTNRGASVRLVGDNQQLAAVAAGGLLRDIARTHGAVRLTQVRRFTRPDGTVNHGEAAASTALRDGDPAAIAYYTDNSRIHVGDRTTTLEHAYTAWAADRAAGLDAVLLAPTRDLVTELNIRARTDRIHTSERPVGATVTLTDGTEANDGDTIITRHNDRRLAISATDWVINGDRWKIERVDADGGLQVQHLTTHRRITLPASYVADHVTLGYATTIHGAQGITADTAHTVATGEETRQVLYVGLTRGRLANHLYLDVTSGTDPHAVTNPDALRPPTAVETLTRVLARDGAAVSATSERDNLHDPATLPHAAVAQYLDAISVAAESVTGPDNLARIDVTAEQLLPGLTAAPAWPALKARLISLGLDDTDPDFALRAAINAAPLAGGDDVASVLTWRLANTTNGFMEGDAATAGPLPWLTPVPRQLAELEQWSRYFQRREERITTYATAVANASADWTSATAPAWARSLLDHAPPIADLLADVAIWRASHDIPDTDVRPTGTPQTDPLTQRAQRQLDARVHDAVDTHIGADAALRIVANRMDPRIAADPYWPMLVAELDKAGTTHRPATIVLRHAATALPLPDEQPAAAIRWRIQEYATTPGPLADAETTPGETGEDPPGYLRWTELAETIHPGLSTDSHWRALARDLDLADAAGWNVEEELPRLAGTGRHPLDPAHPGRDLDLRLADACPASVSTEDHNRKHGSRETLDQASLRRQTEIARHAAHLYPSGGYFSADPSRSPEPPGRGPHR